MLLGFNHSTTLLLLSCAPNAIAPELDELPTELAMLDDATEELVTLLWLELVTTDDDELVGTLLVLDDELTTIVLVVVS